MVCDCVYHRAWTAPWVGFSDLNFQICGRSDLRSSRDGSIQVLSLFEGYANATPVMATKMI
jgi:hypothetical protein